MKISEILSSTAIKEQNIKSKSKTWIQEQAKQQAVRFQSSKAGKLAAGIKGWLTLERIIAIILLIFPFILIGVDG